MGLLDIIPIDQTDDYSFGYCQGQRTCRVNAWMDRSRLMTLAQRSWLRLSTTVNIVWAEYARGFREGYIDELNGTAHPLPKTDVPYGCNELEF